MYLMSNTLGMNPSLRICWWLVIRWLSFLYTKAHGCLYGAFGDRMQTANYQLSQLSGCQCGSGQGLAGFDWPDVPLSYDLQHARTSAADVAPALAAPRSISPWSLESRTAAGAQKAGWPRTAPSTCATAWRRRPAAATAAHRMERARQPRHGGLLHRDGAHRRVKNDGHPGAQARQTRAPPVPEWWSGVARNGTGALYSAQPYTGFECRGVACLEGTGGCRVRQGNARSPMGARP